MMSDENARKYEKDSGECVDCKIVSIFTLFASGTYLILQAKRQRKLFGTALLRILGIGTYIFEIAISTD